MRQTLVCCNSRPITTSGVILTGCEGWQLYIVLFAPVYSMTARITPPRNDIIMDNPGSGVVRHPKRILTGELCVVRAHDYLTRSARRPITKTSVRRSQRSFKRRALSHSLMLIPFPAVDAP